MPDFEVLAVLSVTPPEVVTVVDEQLDCAPPELDDPEVCTPLRLPVPLNAACVFGPVAMGVAIPRGVELVPALELLDSSPPSRRNKD